MMGFRSRVILTTGRERMAYTALDYQEEDYMERVLMHKILLMISSLSCNVPNKILKESFYFQSVVVVDNEVNIIRL
jgi:hypothetical protein